MRFDFGIRSLLSLLILLAFTSVAYITFTPRGFPVSADQVDSNTLVLHALPGISMPPGFQDKDQVDLRRIDFVTRVAAADQRLPLGYELSVEVERGTTTVVLPLKVAKFSDTRPSDFRVQPWFQWPVLIAGTLLGLIALLVLWRGRDRAAFGMALWSIGFLTSAGIGSIPLAGWPYVVDIFLGIPCFLLARVGFYIMIEARLISALSYQQIKLFRILFTVLFLLGALQTIGGQLVRFIFGSDEFLSSQYGLMLSASYLVPIAMLFAGYGPAPAVERQRLRWMLVSGVAWALFILLGNSPILGEPASSLVELALEVIALLGFLYAVLKLRVVDVSVVIDRALVYGLVTALVVGLIAAVNNLALHEIVSPGTGLALQVLVALTLGIVLGRVRDYTDKAVEQLFFRNRYLAEKALRTFARHAGHIESADKLLAAAVSEIRKHLSIPAVAIYVWEATGYRCVQSSGDVPCPAVVEHDDPVPVALRADGEPVELSDFPGALGLDGCCVPMTVLGDLHGFIVCVNRPGEHYAQHEKQLLSRVADGVGAAWRIRRSRDNEKYVRAMAEGEFTLSAARKRARALSLNG